MSSYFVMHTAPICEMCRLNMKQRECVTQLQDLSTCWRRVALLASHFSELLQAQEVPDDSLETEVEEKLQNQNQT